MNIFAALSNGKGSINEENVSSFLAYLLDPNEDHNLDRNFLDKFLDKLQLSPTEINSTTSESIDVKLEFPVDNRFIDIVFETSEHIIAIENKISEKALKDGQVQEEYDRLRFSNCCITDDKQAKDIFMVYLVPEECKNKDTNINTKDKDRYQIVLWKDVLNILKNISEDDSQKDCEYTRHTLNAFINFMNIKPKEFELVEKPNYKYQIFKYKSGKILVQEKNTKDAKWEKAVPSSKAIIKAKLHEIAPVTYNDTTMKKGTTRSLGAKLFNHLK